MPLRQAPERPPQTAAKDETRQAPQHPVPVTQPVQLAQQQKKDLEYLESLVIRNAQIRSNLME
ncbi:hypothetical protein [Comamonas testosteroni]|uniref:hypothetical protein n=1 Tax=Comamonas testosteroni TaxID=285 RepID=UPI0015FAD307|nr:hypothetical protein [Comamonas testosteroni]